MSRQAGTKFCNGCQQQKPVGEFFRKKDAKDGLQYRCKECQRFANRSDDAKQRAAEKRKAYLLAHPDQAREYRRRWMRKSYEIDPTVWRQRADELHQRQRDELADGYIRRLLAISIGCKRSEVPEELIGVQRAHLKLKRLLKEKRNEDK